MLRGTRGRPSRQGCVNRIGVTGFSQRTARISPDPEGSFVPVTAPRARRDAGFLGCRGGSRELFPAGNQSVGSGRSSGKHREGGGGGRLGWELSFPWGTAVSRSPPRPHRWLPAWNPCGSAFVPSLPRPSVCQGHHAEARGASPGQDLLLLPRGQPRQEPRGAQEHLAGGPAV